MVERRSYLGAKRLPRVLVSSSHPQLVPWDQKERGTDRGGAHAQLGCRVNAGRPLASGMRGQVASILRTPRLVGVWSLQGHLARLGQK